jgi:hypothetical protein
MKRALSAGPVFTVRLRRTDVETADVTLRGLMAAAAKHPELVLVHVRPWRGRAAEALVPLANVHLKIASRGGAILADALARMTQPSAARERLAAYHREIGRVFVDSVVARARGAPLAEWVAYVLGVMGAAFEQAKTSLRGQSVGSYVAGRTVGKERV